MYLSTSKQVVVQYWTVTAPVGDTQAPLGYVMFSSSPFGNFINSNLEPDYLVCTPLIY